MATYLYQQNLYEGASHGYVKYNITPDFGTPISPGETVTITGQAFSKNMLVRSIGVSIHGTGVYREAYVNKTIAKGATVTFTIEFSMWTLSPEYWGADRVLNIPIEFTFWSETDGLGNGNVTVENDAQKIMYLAYRLSIASKNVQFERYAFDGANYVKDDEGSFVMGMLAIVFGPGTTVSDITTAAVHIANNGGESEVDFNLPANVLAAALSEGGYVETAPQLFASISFNTAYNYTITFTIGDAYNTTSFSVLVARAFVNVHMSGCPTGGVAFGKFSSATDGSPMFECTYPAYFYGGIHGDEYKEGDVVTLAQCNFLGYVTTGTKRIVFLVPLRKSLERITSATVTTFLANIANSGGYAITSSYVAGGSNYIRSGVTIDCSIYPERGLIEVRVERSSAWDLTNNNAISVRNEMLVIELHE